MTRLEPQPMQSCRGPVVSAASPSGARRTPRRSDAPVCNREDLVESSLKPTAFGGIVDWTGTATDLLLVTPTTTAVPLVA